MRHSPSWLIVFVALLPGRTLISKPSQHESETFWYLHTYMPPSCAFICLSRNLPFRSNIEYRLGPESFHREPFSSVRLHVTGMYLVKRYRPKHHGHVYRVLLGLKNLKPSIEGFRTQNGCFHWDSQSALRVSVGMIKCLFWWIAVTCTTDRSYGTLCESWEIGDFQNYYLPDVYHSGKAVPIGARRQASHLD